jgi:hypothetical protein
MEVKITIYDEEEEIAGVVDVDMDQVPSTDDEVLISASEHDLKDPGFIVNELTWTPLSDDQDALLGVIPRDPEFA